MVGEAAEKLVQVLNKQTDRVIYFSRMENMSPNIVVHELRKSFKRIRALLQLYKINGNEYVIFVEKQLIKFGKALSPIRNSCVNLSVLEKIANENTHIAESKFTLIKETLIRKNRAYLATLFNENLLKGQIGRFMLEFETGFQTHLVPFNKQQLVQQLYVSYASAYNIYTEEYALETWENLHKLRKALKVLGYQYKVLAGQNIKFFRLKMRQLSSLTQILGEDHDLYVFFKEIKGENYRLEVDEIEIIENQINHLHELHQIKIQPKLKQLFTDTPSGFEAKINAIY